MSEDRPLAAMIRREIEALGVIPFARFMELALYAPGLGYYEREDTVVGRRGDFFTSVSVGSLFGELLAFQFAEWAEQAGCALHPGPNPVGSSSETQAARQAPALNRNLTRNRNLILGSGLESESKITIKSKNSLAMLDSTTADPSSLPAGWEEGTRRTSEGPLAHPTLPRVQLVEAGAQDGQMAADILNWWRRQRPASFDSVEYFIIEPSERRRATQQKTLVEFSPRVRWVDSLCRVPSSEFRVLFCNELLDAFPVHRFGWDATAKQWFEWGVGWNGGQFVWRRRPDCARDHLPFPIANPPAELQSVLPDGFVVEASPAAEQWWREAAATLHKGKLLALDYGLTEDERLAPQRQQGTLRAYHRHHPAGDPLARPGEQDLTAHVNFTALQRAGEAAGLGTEAFLSQSQFLTGIAATAWTVPEQFGEWTPQHRRQFQTLTHPEHLGRAFRVLLQGRSG